MSDEQTLDSLWDADAQHTGDVGVLTRDRIMVRTVGGSSVIDWFKV